MEAVAGTKLIASSSIDLADWVLKFLFQEKQYHWSESSQNCFGGNCCMESWEAPYCWTVKYFVYIILTCWFNQCQGFAVGSFLIFMYIIYTYIIPLEMK